MKILIVDDQTFNRQLIRLILEEEQYQCCDAENGQQACDIVAADSEIDLILLDVNMPVMDGYQAARWIKDHIGERYLPIVFVTAMDDEAVMAKCLASGGDDFVPKPVSDTILLAKLSAYRRTIELYRELQESNRHLHYHQQLMDREHHIVEKIFSNNMQKLECGCDNVRFHVSPMSMFNGDVFLIAPSPLGGLYVLLGDFTGHGLAAAVGCLPVSDIFFSMTKARAGVGAIAREINRKLLDLLPPNMFCCALLAELDSSGDRLTVWNGGMHDLLIVDEDRKVDAIAAQHMALGILVDNEFDDTTELLTPMRGKRVYLYTDGLIEAQNQAGNFYGEERLTTLLASEVDPLAAIINSVEIFQAEQGQSDDLAIVELVCQEVQFNNGVEPCEQLNPNRVLPWQLSLTLLPEQLRKPTLVREVVNLVAGAEGAENHRDILFTIITELFSNALEHGLLRLSSSLKSEDNGFARYYELRQQRLDALQDGKIEMHIDMSAEGELTVSLTDTGDGFDVASRTGSDSDNHARGVDLVESLCEQLHYSNCGRTVSASYLVSSR